MNLAASFWRVAVLLACVGGPVSACYVEAETVPIAVDGYEPLYYDGYIVYYDGLGRPFYYSNGIVVWIGPEYPEYGVLVHHWHVYGPAYRHWYAHYGYRYRTYRRR